MSKLHYYTDKKISKNVIRTDDSYWHWYTHIPKTKQKITGKYLFFSEYKEELEKITIEELENSGFFLAKINKTIQMGTDYVLCLYFKDDSRKKELAAKYGSNARIKYRYWKSDEDTMKGKYSEHFLATLSPEEIEMLTSDKSN